MLETLHPNLVEAPERLSDFTEGPGVHFPDKSARQLDSPSLGRALDHGSARVFGVTAV